MLRLERSRSANMASWYLIRTKPAREALAQANLVRQGYRVYFPRLEAAKPGRGSPLFPRYLFICVDVRAQAVGPVRSTVGVANIVSFNSEYAVVPDAVIEELRRRADPKTGMHHLGVTARLAPGSPVRILAGVFDSLEGVFQRESGDERVVVLLSVLGRRTPVEFPAEFVSPLTARSWSTTPRRARNVVG
jgi:transcriptional antiterminator RfaH